MNTLNQEEREGSAAHREQHGGTDEGGEGARHRSPPPKPQFIILRDTLYRSAAFSLFVILATQKRSQRRILSRATCSRDEGWRLRRMSRRPHFVGRLCLQSQVRFHNNNTSLRPAGSVTSAEFKREFCSAGEEINPCFRAKGGLVVRHVAQFLDKAGNPCINYLPLRRVSLVSNGRYRSFHTFLTRPPRGGAAETHPAVCTIPLKPVSGKPPTR